MARKDVVIPSPPRPSGDPASDIIALTRWLNDFYNTAVRLSGLLNPNFQATPDTFDANNLFDPENTTIANAQLTANLAYNRLSGALETLFEERTYYVSTHGSDADNDGLTVDTPFRTIAYATSFVLTHLILNRHVATIKIADGYYDESGTRGVLITGSPIGNDNGYIHFLGNTDDPAAVIVDPGGHNSFHAFAGPYIIVEGVSVQSNIRDCLVADVGGYIDFLAVNFLPTTRFHCRADGGRIRPVGDYEISGGAVAHWCAKNGAAIEAIDSGVITLTGTPAFSNGFAEADFGKISVGATTSFVGTATGPQYLVQDFGVVDVNGKGLSYLPGSLEGTQLPGGLFVS